MKNVNVANFLWVGHKLSLYEWKCIESFVKNGFDVNVYTYGNLEIPNGANLLDGRLILPESEVYAYTQEGKKGSPTSFSNIFRYELLKLRAGWWFDADIYCLRHVNDWISLAESKKGSVVLGWENDELINNAVMFSDNTLFDESLKKHAIDIGKVVSWGELGPKLLTKVVKQLNLTAAALAENHFYPIHFYDLNKMFDPEQIEYCLKETKNSYCIHLWNEVLNRNKIPKNLPPPSESFLYKLFSTHSALNESIALPIATCMALFELDTLHALNGYKKNPHAQKIVNFLRMLNKIKSKFNRQ